MPRIKEMWRQTWRESVVPLLTSAGTCWRRASVVLVGRATGGAQATRLPRCCFEACFARCRPRQRSIKEFGCLPAGEPHAGEFGALVAEVLPGPCMTAVPGVSLFSAPRPTRKGSVIGGHDGERQDRTRHRHRPREPEYTIEFVTALVGGICINSAHRGVSRARILCLPCARVVGGSLRALSARGRHAIIR